MTVTFNSTGFLIPGGSQCLKEIGLFLVRRVQFILNKRIDIIRPLTQLATSRYTTFC